MKAFFDHLYRNCENGKIEFRLLPSTHKKFVALGDTDSANGFLKSNENVYFAVALRDGLAGTKENITEIPAVWCDCDFKDSSREAVAEKLSVFPFKPSCIIDSGGGLHLYWILKEPLGKESINSVEDVHRRIAHSLIGDLGSCEAAHILRVPGTRNFKYNPPVLVELKSTTDFTYTLEDFLEILPEFKDDRKRNSEILTNGDWISQAMQGCAEGERDTTATKIAGYYINKLNLSDTSAILYAWNKLNRPPLPDQDIHKVLRSVSRYKPVEPTEKTGVKIDNVYDADKMVSSYREYLKNLKNNRFRTGIDEIDAKIRGVGGGEVLTIIARAGGFKTAMLQHMLKNYTKYSSNGAIFFSLEMPIANITERFFSMLDGCTGREVENTFNNPNMSKITESSILQFKNDLKNLYVVDSKICLNDVKQYIEIIEKNYNKKIGVVGIDYLGLIDAAGKDEYQIVSSIARGVKDLAKAVNLPIVLLSQVSRKGGDGEVEVSLDMGRGSGAIEEGADFVIGLWQEEKSLAVEETEYNLISRILKNRKGPKGSKWVIDLEPKTLQFSGKSYKYIEPIKKTRKGKTA